MSHQDFINDLYSEYVKNPDNWLSNPLIVQRAMKKYYNNQQSHYELLRLIIYKLDEEKYDEKYLLFLQMLLFTLLEENAISLIYREKESPEIYFNPGLKKILRKHPEIFLDDKGLSISNTQTHKLIDELINTKKKTDNSGGKKRKTKKRNYKKSKRYHTKKVSKRKNKKN